MAPNAPIQIRHPTLGVCGLSCLLCPRHQSAAASRCEGCKTPSRLGAACSMQTCALKKQKVEYCGYCCMSKSCPKWANHREAGRKHDSFVSYGKLEENIALIQQNGVSAWERLELKKERLLRMLLAEYDEGRSKNYLCLAVTLLRFEDLKAAMEEEKRNRPAQSDLKSRSIAIHAVLDRMAEKTKAILALRK